MPPTPDDLARRASEVVTHLSQFDVWAPSLPGAVVDDGSHTVQELQPAPGASPSYVIFTVRRNSQITARLLLDPRTAQLLEVEGVHRAGGELPPFVDPVDALRRHLPLPPAAPISAAAPHLVWKYSAESTSRFRPFWLVVTSHQTFYVRVDGAIFTTLTKSDR